MTTNDNFLQKAKDSLLINDVYIEKMICNTESDFDPKYDEDALKLETQLKHVVRGSKIIELNGNGQLLRVEIEVGMRWVVPNDSEQPIVKALIEADFIAEYIIQEPLESKSIELFSLENASYHVWPYWRELLSSQCERMRLNRIALPTIQLASNRHSKEESVEL